LNLHRTVEQLLRGDLALITSITRRQNVQPGFWLIEYNLNCSHQFLGYLATQTILKRDLLKHVAQCCSRGQPAQAIDFSGKNWYSCISYLHMSYPQKLLAVGAKQSRVLFQVSRGYRKRGPGVTKWSGGSRGQRRNSGFLKISGLNSTY